MKTKTSDNVLLVTVTKAEATALLAACAAVTGTASVPQTIDGRIYHSLGSVGGLRLFMVQSQMGAIGPGAALLTVYEGIKALSPGAVIMVGIAFGTDRHTQNIGDILVSRRILSYEPVRVGTSAKGTLKLVPRGYRVAASTKLLNRFDAADLTWKGARVRFGLIVSGEKLIDNESFRDQLLQLEPEAIGGEMEGAGLYAAAQDSNTDWILVKAISDWADGRKDENRIASQEAAARNAAEFVMHALNQGLLAQRTPQSGTKPLAAQDMERTFSATLRIEGGRVIWLLDMQNWRRHGKAILIALLVLAAAVLISVTPKIVHRGPAPRAFAPPIGSTAAISTATAPDTRHTVEQQPGVLSDEQIRTAITSALHHGRVAAAIGYLHYLRDAKSKTEECQHVFDFCIASQKLEDAEAVVSKCWEGANKEDKLRQIEMERLKR
jgi:nucleoside phosphorylase